MNNSAFGLEFKLIYAVIVAGKSAAFTDKVMGRLFLQDESPFERIKMLIELHALESELRHVKSGNYGKLLKCFPLLIKIDPAKCSIEELESIPGIGPKTSRFFLLWTRPGVELAALDTHILKWLRLQGYDAPKTTPTGKKYAALEQIFLNEASKRGISARELDEQIWLSFSNRASRGK